MSRERCQATHEIDVERETPTPALVLIRTQEEPHAAGSLSRADDVSLSGLRRTYGIVRTRYAFKLTLGGNHRAGDIVQETRLRAGRYPAVAGGHAGTVRPWLFTVARPIAIGLWRALSRHDHVREDQLTGQPSPVEPIDQAMTAMDVRVALAQLRPEHRQVIVEMFYLGRSVTEIAQLLSIPEGTVISRSYYGLRELKRYGGNRRRRLSGLAQGDG
jgi:RNA polymerase sigma-70 factor, ECF subfamily